MGKKCAKCGYIQPETAGRYESDCPKCGTAYDDVPTRSLSAEAPAIAPPVMPPTGAVLSQPKPTRSTGGFAVFGSILLAIVALGAFFSGVSAAAVGTSAIHQILTAIYFLTFTVAIGALSLLSGLRRRD